MAEEQQQPEEGSAEALAEALKMVPSDKAKAMAPKISDLFDRFVVTVYPNVVASSKQYREMKMVWNIAFLEFLNIAHGIGEQTMWDQDLGSEMLYCMMIEATAFLKEYQKSREENK